ncbi:Uncharacterised protein [Mycobacteroides abscessus subsp. bolletii]|uniref:hypothetical protein n=1 Tax=Mycobacteroides abscessus TaxID=36809 RepID=UPI00092CA53D|nr:hypothetical protein [Mycobacteroides abscessus]SIJ61775.1 Uncharacterised protein [Mycobacteroides abscessus subsp. bolletii]
MTVTGARNTPAMRARDGRMPTATHTFTQAQLRERRHQGLPVKLGGGWSLRDEVAEIVEPLTAVDQTRPLSYARCVDDLTEAVHTFVHDVVGLLARADAERRTRHIGIDQRGRSIQALVDLTVRPRQPVITDKALIDGTWAVVLVELTEPYSSDLATLLGNAATTAVSDRIIAGLRAVDATAAVLQRRLENIPRSSADAPPVPTEADRARAELEEMGISL